MTPAQDATELADKIDNWSPDSRQPLTLIARERRMIVAALRAVPQTPDAVRSRIDREGGWNAGRSTPSPEPKQEAVREDYDSAAILATNERGDLQAASLRKALERGTAACDGIHDAAERVRAVLNPSPDGRGAVIEATRRKAQERADFWFVQAEKNESRSGHYLVVANQFQNIATALSQVPATDGAGSSVSRPDRNPVAK